MLVLSVTTGLRLILPSGEVIRIVNTEPQRRARLGIEAPKNVKIVRDGMKLSEKQPAQTLPLDMETRVNNWLLFNQIDDPNQVPWCKLPLGMLQGLIERAKKSEAV